MCEGGLKYSLCCPFGWTKYFYQSIKHEQKLSVSAQNRLR
jgi:hypothetical protein